MRRRESVSADCRSNSVRPAACWPTWSTWAAHCSAADCSSVWAWWAGIFAADPAAGGSARWSSGPVCAGWRSGPACSSQWSRWCCGWAARFRCRWVCSLFAGPINCPPGTEASGRAGRSPGFFALASRCRCYRMCTLPSLGRWGWLAQNLVFFFLRARRFTRCARIWVGFRDTNNYSWGRRPYRPSSRWTMLCGDLATLRSWPAARLNRFFCLFANKKCRTKIALSHSHSPNWSKPLEANLLRSRLLDVGFFFFWFAFFVYFCYNFFFQQIVCANTAVDETSAPIPSCSNSHWTGRIIAFYLSGWDFILSAGCCFVCVALSCRATHSLHSLLRGREHHRRAVLPHTDRRGEFSQSIAPLRLLCRRASVIWSARTSFRVC